MPRRSSGGQLAEEDEQGWAESGGAETNQREANREAGGRGGERDHDEPGHEQRHRRGADARVRVTPVAEPAGGGCEERVWDRHPAHEQAGGALRVAAEQHDVVVLDEQRERREHHAAGGEADGEVEAADPEEAAIAQAAQRVGEAAAHRDLRAQVGHGDRRARERDDDGGAGDHERRDSPMKSASRPPAARPIGTPMTIDPHTRPAVLPPPPSPA